MTAFVEFIDASTLNAGGCDACEFERIWRRLDFGPRAWRSHRLLPEDQGLFIKGLRVPLVVGSQAWRRRWDIHHEIAVLRRLGGAGLPVPRPIAWGFTSTLGVPRRSFLLIGAVSDSVNVAELLRTPGPRERRLAALRAAGAVVARMHGLGIRHGDLACRNILLRWRDDVPEAFLVDFARAHLAASNDRRLRRTDLDRLAKTARRNGASEEEVLALLQPAAGHDAARIVQLSRAMRRIRLRPLRKLRLLAWRIAGL
jgi:tRNA A-37 threonylcarbamoyl transferase component Bud32